MPALENIQRSGKHFVISYGLSRSEILKGMHVPRENVSQRNTVTLLLLSPRHFYSHILDWLSRRSNKETDENAFIWLSLQQNGKEPLIPITGCSIP